MSNNRAEKERDAGQAGNMTDPLQRLVRQVSFSEFLFEFDSYEHWVDKARTWFLRTQAPHDAVCIDMKGRICTRGKHFMVAKDEDAFPVKVYRV